METFALTIIMLGFFTTVIALVALRYRQTEPAIVAIKLLSRLLVPLRLGGQTRLNRPSAADEPWEQG